MPSVGHRRPRTPTSGRLPHVRPPSGRSRVPSDPPSSGAFEAQRSASGRMRDHRRRTRRALGAPAESFLQRLDAARAPLARATSSEQVYVAIMEAFKIAIGAESIGVLKVVDKKLRLKAQDGFSIEQLRTAGGRIGERILGRLAARGGNYVAPNIAEARKRGDPVLAVCVKTDASTVVIAIYRLSGNRSLDRHTGLLLDELVKLVAHSLEYGDRLDALQTELSALRDLSSLSVAGHSLDFVLEKGLMWVKRIVHSERRIVVLPDRLSGDRMRARAIRGEGRPLRNPVDFAREQSLCGQVLADGVSVSYGDLLDVPVLAPAEPFLDGPLLAMPLSANDKRIGVLVMCRSPHQPHFSGDERERLEPVARQIALAVEAAQQYELAIERGEELAAVVRSITDGVMVTAPNGRLLLANPASRLLLGLDESEPVDQEREAAVVEEVFGRPELEQDEEKLLEPSTNPGRILKVKLSPFIGKDGLQRGVVAALDDITREKELAKAKDAFLSSVSHELRTPLTSIVSSVAVLKRYAKKGGDEVIAKFARIIEESTGRLNTIVEECLELANLEQGMAVWNFESASIAALLERCLARHEKALAEREIELESQIDPALGETAVDQAKLERTVDHLLELALENTSAGGKIQIGAGLDGPITVWLAEFERSMRPEEIRSAFAAFEQVDPDDLSKTTSGLGVRLPICKTIIERHGGKIWIEGGDAGVRYVFTLPVQTVEEVDAQVRPTSVSRLKSVADGTDAGSSAAIRIWDAMLEIPGADEATTAECPAPDAPAEPDERDP